MIIFNWGKITPLQFEELCYELIEAIGFKHINWRKGSSDEGRDIEAIFRTIEPDEIYEEEWFFECKKYTSRGIPLKKIADKFYWAEEEKADRLVIMSNSHVTKNAKRWLDEQAKNKGLKVRYWTNKKFENILLKYPYITEKYFPDLKISKFTQTCASQEDIFEHISGLLSAIGVPPPLLEEFSRSRPILNENDVRLLYAIRKKSEEIEKCPRISIKNVDAYFKLGDAEVYSGNYKSAIKHYNNILGEEPNNVVAWASKGIALAKLKKYKGAGECFSNAQKFLSPDIEKTETYLSTFLSLRNAIQSNCMDCIRDCGRDCLDEDGNPIENIRCPLQEVRTKYKITLKRDEWPKEVILPNNLV